MSKKIVILGLVLAMMGGFSSLSSAQTRARIVKISPLPATSADVSATASASSSATATTSADTASPSAAVELKVQEQSNKDITQTTSKTKDILTDALDQHPVGPLSWNNFLQHAIRRAITNGLPANIVILILLFPLITSIISFSRHIVGLKGFGVYIPAVLAVAFVSTGVVNGILLFIIILATAMVMKRILKTLKLQYLPRTAMLLWGVSIVVLAVLVAASFVPVNAFLTINIFPLLIIMLLTENFMESQLSSSQSETIWLTLETLIIAIFCSLFIGSEMVQQYVILHPELTLLLVAAVNLIVGRYAGLRLLEWIRFRSIIDQ